MKIELVNKIVRRARSRHPSIPDWPNNEDAFVCLKKIAANILTREDSTIGKKAFADSIL